MKRLTAIIALCVLWASPALAATDRVEIGLLDCIVQGGTGFIIGSTKHFSCTFNPSHGRTEHYAGTVRKLGLDIGHTSKSFIKWAVWAPTSHSYARGALAGHYVGASAEVTAGAGLGANALIGGSDKTIVLQPVSVQAQEGLNLAVGLTSFEMTSVR